MSAKLDDPIAETQRWIQSIVIGLNLCPFAKAVVNKGQVHYQLSHASNEEELLHDLADALQHLTDTPAEEIDTTLIIHPQCLNDFYDFNDFLDKADALLVALELDGIIQIANFHPDYQFSGTSVDDISNYTNRSPYPTLHLLREDSVSRAVDAFPDPDTIVEKNIDTLNALGIEGLRHHYPD